MTASEWTVAGDSTKDISPRYKLITKLNSREKRIITRQNKINSVFGIKKFYFISLDMYKYFIFTHTNFRGIFFSLLHICPRKTQKFPVTRYSTSTQNIYFQRDIKGQLISSVKLVFSRLAAEEYIIHN